MDSYAVLKAKKADQASIRGAWHFTVPGSSSSSQHSQKQMELPNSASLNQKSWLTLVYSALSAGLCIHYLHPLQRSMLSPNKKDYFWSISKMHLMVKSQFWIAQLTEAAKYTDFISAEVEASHHEFLECDTKQSDGEAPIMLDFGGMWSTPSLPSLTGLLWHGVVAPDRVLSIG